MTVLTLHATVKPGKAKGIVKELDADSSTFRNELYDELKKVNGFEGLSEENFSNVSGKPESAITKVSHKFFVYTQLLETIIEQHLESIYIVSSKN